MECAVLGRRLTSSNWAERASQSLPYVRAPAWPLPPPSPPHLWDLLDGCPQLLLESIERERETL